MPSSQNCCDGESDGDADDDDDGDDDGMWYEDAQARLLLNDGVWRKTEYGVWPTEDGGCGQMQNE